MMHYSAAPCQPWPAPQTETSAARAPAIDHGTIRSTSNRAAATRPPALATRQLDDRRPSSPATQRLPLRTRPREQWPGMARPQITGGNTVPSVAVVLPELCVPLVPTEEQVVSRTRSRRCGPRRWLQSVEWLVKQHLHAHVSQTTLAIARDLAARMDFDLGHVRYCLAGMVLRLGLSRATISRHVAYLRELGSLVWVERGSRTNVQRARGLAGYARTATVYGAVIPAGYDHAHSHTLVGTGYSARIVIDQRGHVPPPALSTVPVDNSPVDNSSSQAGETPSRTWPREVDQLKVAGGCNHTPGQRTSRSTTQTPHQNTLLDGRRRTADDVRRSERTSRLVRALVSWTQPVKLRRLEYVLRPLTDRGLNAHEIAAELTAMCSGLLWRPKRPDVFITARLATAASYDQQLTRETEMNLKSSEHSVPAMSNSEWATWIEGNQRQAADARPRTNADRAAARADWNIWPEVNNRLEEDQEDALDLYGVQLCNFATRQSARLSGGPDCCGSVRSPV